MLLTESKLTEVLTEGLRYHLDTKTPLYENVYRPGSEAYFNTIKQARHLLSKGILTELCLEDMELLFETEVGEYGEYEGQKVPLDFPMTEAIVVTEPQTTELTQAWNTAKQNQTIVKVVNDQAQKKNMEPYSVWLDMASKGKAAGGAAYTIDVASISQYLSEEEDMNPDADISAVMPIIAEYKEEGTKKYLILSGQDTYREIQGTNTDVWVVDITIYQEGTVAEYKGYSDTIQKYLATWANIFDKMLDAHKAGNLTDYIETLSGTARKAADAFKGFIESNAETLTEAKLDTDEKKSLVRKLMRAAYSTSAEKSLAQILDDIEKKLTGDRGTQSFVRYIDGVRVDEAKYQGKEVKLNKPQRGGSKKFFVYTKNPKTGKVVKVSFGGTTGLKAKINNAEARRNFAARHNCATKKDKTKSGYWSCRLPRYASLLGLKSSFGGYW